MSVFATRSFARFARKCGLTDHALLGAAEALGRGRFDASLGNGVFKQRVARAGGGKSRGFRTIIFFRANGHTFFAYGFAKNRKANVSIKELEALKKLAAELLGFTEEQIALATTAGELLEIIDHGEEE